MYLNNNLIDIDKNENYFDGLNSKDMNIIKIKWDDIILTTRNMFKNCYNITEIDLSNFDISKVKDISKMFFNCTSLASLNLSNFKTSLVKDMSYMFYACQSLISLNLSKFNTLEVINMNNMFFNLFCPTNATFFPRRTVKFMCLKRGSPSRTFKSSCL